MALGRLSAGIKIIISDGVVLNLEILFVLLCQVVLHWVRDPSWLHGNGQYFSAEVIAVPG